MIRSFPKAPVRVLPTLTLALLLGACATMPQAAAPELADPAPATTVFEQLAATAATGETGWGFPVYDVMPDPSVRYGVLSNGMKYAIMRNETPKESAVIRMRFDFGSIAEAENEQGIAHFLEHMAFNGSQNVPEGEMTKILERLGLAFGADTNASTGFEETIYKLDLPRTDDEMVDTALMLMRETASNLTLDPEAIDRERGVILSEMRTRDSFGLRRLVDYFEFLGPDTPFHNRLPIGTREVLETADAATFRSIYNRYYRPEKTTLVIVGDFDPDAIEAKVRAQFGDWQGVGPAGADLDHGEIDLSRAAAFDSFVDPDVPYMVSINVMRPYREVPDTIAEGRRGLLVALGSAIMNRRFQKIANASDSPILGGGVGISDYFEAARSASVSITAKEGEWQTALAIGENELRRAMQYGFTEAELAEQLANFQLAVNTQADQADTRRSRGLADAILGTVDDEEIFSTPAFRRDAFNLLKPTLALDAVNAIFREEFTGSAPLVHVSSKEEIAGGDAAIMAAFSAARQVAVTPPAAEEVLAFAYDDFGAPATVVSDTVIEDLGIRTIRFSNNVMLNLKKTDFEQGRARYNVRIGSGELQLPQDKPGLAIFMSSMFANAGLGQHSFDELRAILAGRDVSPGLRAGSDGFATSGSTTMADLPLQMKVTAAYLADPGYREEAQSRWNSLVPTFSAQLDATPQSVRQRDVSRVLASGDERFGISDEATLLQRNLGELKAVIDPVFASAPIEIAVVGDIDEQAVIDAVAASFGALPARDAAFGEFADQRIVNFRESRDPVVLTHAGKEDQALALAYWPTEDDEDFEREVRFDMLSGVMRLMLLEEIREKLGATYSPGTSTNQSAVYEDYGTFGASVIVSPDRADEVYDAIRRITAQLRDAPVDDDVLARARTPLLERIAKRERENSYWMGLADRAQSETARLDRTRAYEGYVRAITTADLQRLARQYLTDDKMLEIRIVHESLVDAQ